MKTKTSHLLQPGCTKYPLNFPNVLNILQINNIIRKEQTENELLISEIKIWIE